MCIRDRADTRLYHGESGDTSVFCIAFLLPLYCVLEFDLLSGIELWNLNNGRLGDEITCSTGKDSCVLELLNTEFTTLARETDNDLVNIPNLFILLSLICL